MNEHKYCNIRSNFCQPEDIVDFSDIGKNYVYGVDIVKYQDDKENMLQHPYKSIINYKYRLLERRGLVDQTLKIGALIVIRPRALYDRNSISHAYVEPEFCDEIGGCTFYIGNTCTCPTVENTPYFCKHNLSKYQDPESMWGYVTREVADAWIDKQIEIQYALRSYVAAMTKQQRQLLVQDYRTPTGALVHLGIIDKGLFMDEDKTD